MGLKISELVARTMPLTAASKHPLEGLRPWA
jgi:hypothetical protein